MHSPRVTTNTSTSIERLPLLEAAQRAGVSVAKLRRAIKAGQVRGAVQESQHSNSRWLVPLSSLKQAGFKVSDTDAAMDAASVERERLSAALQAALDRCAQTEALVERLDRQLEASEARNAELSKLLSLALELQHPDVAPFHRGAA